MEEALRSTGAGLRGFKSHAGSFFSVPIPPAINTLKYIFIAVLIVTLFVASLVYRGSR